MIRCLITQPLTFAERLLCAKSHGKHFVSTISFSPYNNLAPCHSGGDGGRKDEEFLELTGCSEVEALCSPGHPTGTWGSLSERRLYQCLCVGSRAHVLKTVHHTCASLSHRRRGGFLQSRVQLRGGGLHRPPRVLRKDRHLPPLEGLGPRRTPRKPSSETAGNVLLGGESQLGTARAQAPRQMLGMQGGQQPASCALESPEGVRTQV